MTQQLPSAPPPFGQNWLQWAGAIVRYLNRVRGYAASFISFDKINDIEVDEGEAAWNAAENTLDIGHGGGVIQQVGFEQYMRCKNATGSTIGNAKVVGFAGVSSDDILMSKYIANGTVPSVYFIGVTTRDVENNVTCPVTIYGKVRDFDTSAWSVGDILYASPATAGELTNIRPTAPNRVITVAAVLKSHATEGVIMVRPSFTPALDYGAFYSTVDQSAAAANTAYAFTYNNTQINSGVTLTNSSRLNVAQAGFYKVSFSAQLVTDSNKGDLWIWLRKSGTDIANTARKVNLESSDMVVAAAWDYPISLIIDDYIEIMWATDQTDLHFEADAATAFAPSAPSIIATLTQVQL